MKRLPLLLTLLALAAAPSRAEDPATNAPAIPESVAELSRVLSEQEGYPIPVGMIFARALNEEMTADEFARAKLAELGVEGWADAGDGATGEDDPPNPFLGEPNPNLVPSPPKPSPDNPAARALEAWWRAEKEREPAAVALLVADASGRPAFDVVPLDDPAAPSRAELVRLDALPGNAEWMLRLPGPDVSAETWFSADTLAPTGGLLRIRGLEGRGDAGSPSARAAEILPPECAVRRDSEGLLVSLSNPNPFPLLVETSDAPEGETLLRSFVTAETRRWWQTEAVAWLRNHPFGPEPQEPRRSVRERVLRPGGAEPLTFPIRDLEPGERLSSERVEVRVPVSFRDEGGLFLSRPFEAETVAADGRLSDPAHFAAPGVCVHVRLPKEGESNARATLVNVSDEDLFLFCDAEFRPARVRAEPGGPGVPLEEGYLRMMDPMSGDGGIACCDHPFCDWEIPMPADGSAPPVPTVSVVRRDVLLACRSVDEIVARLAEGTVTPSDPAPPPRDEAKAHRHHRHVEPELSPNAPDPPPLLLDARIEGTNLVASVRIGGDRPVLAFVHRDRRTGVVGMNAQVDAKIGPGDEYHGLFFGVWSSGAQIGEFQWQHYDPEFYRLFLPGPDTAPLRWIVPQPDFFREMMEISSDGCRLERRYFEFSVWGHVLWPETKSRWNWETNVLVRESGFAEPPDPSWTPVVLPLAPDAELPDGAGKSAGWFRGFELDEAVFAGAERFELRLGPIHGIATVSVNGQTIDVRNDSDTSFIGEVPRVVLGSGTNSVEVAVSAVDGRAGLRASDAAELVLRAVPRGGGPAREIPLDGTWLVFARSERDCPFEEPEEPDGDPVFAAEGGADGEPVRCEVRAPDGGGDWIVEVDGRGVPACVVEPLPDPAAPSRAVIDGLRCDSALFRRLPPSGGEPLRFSLDAARFAPTGKLARLCGIRADPAAKESGYEYHSPPECRIERDRSAGELVVTVAATNYTGLVETFADGTGARAIRTTVRAENRTENGFETVLPETPFGPVAGQPGWFPVLQKLSWSYCRHRYLPEPPGEFVFRVPVGRDAIEADRIVLRTTVRWGLAGIGFAVPFREAVFEIVDGIPLPNDGGER